MTPIKVRLPSGQLATLRKPVPNHPWEAVREGSVFVLRRLKRGDSSVNETFTNHGVQAPLCLNQEDAEALAAILNEGQSHAVNAVSDSAPTEC